MHLRDQLLKFNLLFLSILLLFGCNYSSQTQNPQIKFESMVLHENSWAENPSFTISSDFEYTSIIFRLYFSEDNGWKFLHQYTFQNIGQNSFTIGNDMSDNVFSKTKMFIQCDDICEYYQCKELSQYEEFHTVVGFHIESKDLDYNETPLYVSRFTGNEDYVSIVKTWKENNIENMDMSVKVPTDNVRYYVFTYQFVK